MCIAIVYKPGCDVMNFEFNVFPTWPKSRDKNLYISRKKKAFKMK